MKNSFNFFGFKINTKYFILSLVILIAVVSFLLGADLLGWFSVSWYGVIIGIGFILAVVIASELTKERSLYKDLPYDLIWLVFPFAIIGARVFYVVNSLHEFNSFWEMVKMWEGGGLSIYGGIIFGIIAVLIFSAIKKINPLRIMDIAAPVLAFGQSIGRWGNFVNQEVYGFEITNKALQWFPFGVKIGNTWHLATFFYESVLNLIGFFVLVTILRKTKTNGVVAFSYFVWYGVIRLFLESLREPEYILLIPGTNIQFSSLVSVLIIVTGVIGLIVLNLKAKKANTSEAN